MPFSPLRPAAYAAVTLCLVSTVLGGAAVPAGAAAFSARASVAPGMQYVGDSAGTTFTFTIENTGTSDSIGAVEIGRPGKSWTITACPSTPDGWTAQRSDTMCRYRSVATTADDIAPGEESSDFQIRATAPAGSQNQTGTWPVKVSRSSLLDKKSVFVADAATPTGLAVTAYSFEVLDVIVDPANTTPGAPCPPAGRAAESATTGHTLVVCGRNRTTATLTPTATRSSLAGTFVDSADGFTSGPIVPTTDSRILGSWDDVTIAAALGDDRTVIAEIGSATNRTSPLTTLEHYEVTGETNAPPVAVDDDADVAEDSAGLDIDVLGNDTDEDGDALSVTDLDTAGTDGTVTNNGTDISYAPDGAFDSLGVGESTTDTFGYTVSDGHGGTDIAVVTVTVTGGDDAPVLAGIEPGTLNYVENDAATPLTVTGTVVDADSDDFATGTLTVSFSAGGQAEDRLAVAGGTTPIGTVVGGTNGSTPLVVTLNASATPAAVQALLRAVTYRNVSDAPSTTARTVRFVVTDGDGGTSAPATRDVTVVPVNDAPTATNDSVTVAEDAVATVVTVLGNDSDPDGDPLAITELGLTGTAGTVTNNSTDVSYDPNGAFDALGAGDTATDTFSYTIADGDGGTDTATVTITITGVATSNTAPVAADDAATVGEDAGPTEVTLLDNDTDANGDSLAVTAVNATGTTGTVSHNGTTASYDPNGAFTALGTGQTATDTFEYTVSDGRGGTDTGTVTITITGVNDAPVIAGIEAGALAYAENAAPTPITATGTVADVDSDNLATGTLTVSFTAGSQVEDRLAVAGGTTIGTAVGGTNGSTPLVITLNATATPASVQALLRSITYANVSNDPSTTARTVQFVLSDGDGGTSTPDTRGISVAAVDDAPVAVADGGVVAQGAAPTGIPVLANDTDVDAGPKSVASASDPAHGTVVLTGGTSGAHTGLTYEPDPGYCNTPPGTVLDTFTYTLNGGSTTTVSVTVDCSVNAAPVIAAIGATPLNVTEGDPFTVITATGTVTDADSANFAGGTLTVDFPVGTQPADQLEILHQGVGVGEIGVSGSNVTYGGTTIGVFAGGLIEPLVVDLNASATPDAVQALLRQVTYRSLSEAPVASRTVRFVLTDGDGGTSTPVTRDITVTAVNDPPVVNLAAPSPLAYAEQAAFTAIAPAATVVDPDSSHLGSLTVTITVGGTLLDTLRLDPAIAGFTTSYDSSTGVLTLTRVGGTVAEYQTALRSVQFGNTDNDPDNRNDGTADPIDASRTLSVVAHDGALDSSPVTRVVTITPVNDAPGAPTVLPTTAGVRNTTLVSGVTTTEPHVVRPAVALVGNAVDPDNLETAISVVPVASAATGSGGTIDLAANGDLRYEPPASGTLTSDTYGYALTDGTTASSPITLTVNLSGTVWYVADQAMVGANGTAARPFASVSAALAAAPAGQPVHIRRGSGDGVLTGQAVLETGDKLLGEGVALTSTDVGSATPETLFPAGTRPVLTAVNIDVVKLATNSVLAGLSVDPHGGGGVYGESTTGVVLRSMDVTDTGTAAVSPGIWINVGGVTFTAPVSISTTQAGALRILGAQVAGTIDSINVSGATLSPGIGLSANTGTLTVSNASITTSGVTGISLGGAGTVQFPAPGSIAVTTTGEKALLVDSTNLGTSVFDSVTVTGSSKGAVSMTNTTGSTTFGDGVGTDLALTTVAAAPVGPAQSAFRLSNAGTVVVPAAGTANVSAATSPAIDVQGTPGAALAFDDVDSTGSTTDGIILKGLDDGTFSANASSTLTGYEGVGLNVLGGTGTVTYAGAISNGPLGDQTAMVQGRTGGAVTLSGSISDTSAVGGGLLLLNNTAGSTTLSGTSKVFNTGTANAVFMSGSANHTLTLSGGGLDIDTTSGAGIRTEIGGTIAVSGTGNTIATGTGTAVMVTSSTIGAAGMTLQSVSANGATNGIFLSPTTGSTGGFTVTGTGVADSGGTIANTSGAGIDLARVRNVSFNNVRIQGANRAGIQGSQVNGFSFTNGTITGAGDSLSNDNDSSIALNGTVGGQNNNVDGVVTITGNTLTGAYGGGVDIFNYAGTITNATISDNTISSSFDPALSRRSGIALNLFGSTTTVASLTTATIADNTVTGFPSGDGISIQGANTAGATAPAGTYGTPGGAPVTISGNFVIGDVTNKMNGFGISASVTGRGQGSFVITDNGSAGSPLRNMKSSAIAIGAAGNVTTYFTVMGNQISANNGFSSAGLALGTDKNIQADSSVLASPIVRTTIMNNTISDTSGPGVRVLHRDSNGSLDLRLESNTITNVLGNLSGIRVENGSSGSVTYNPTMCASIANNEAASGAVDGSGDKNAGINLYKESDSATTYKFGLTGLAPSPASNPQVEAHLTTLNPLSATGLGFFAGRKVAVRTGSNYTNCTLPAGV